MSLANREADLRAAAQALASWLHARRATWTTAPVPHVAPPPPAVRVAAYAPEPPHVPPPIGRRMPEPVHPADPILARPPEPAVAWKPEAPVAAPPPPSPFSSGVKIELAPIEESRTEPAARMFQPETNWVASTRSRLPPPDTSASPAGRRLMWAGIAVGLGAAVAIGAPRLRPLLQQHAATPASQAPAPPEPPEHAEAPAAAARAGSLHVASTPEGARVYVDGKDRGVTPLAIAQIAAGRHEVTIESSAGTVRRTVTVAASQTATIDESIFSGWTLVYAPFEVVVSEHGRVLTPDERNQIMLPAGTHQLRVTNRALAYDSVQAVDITPGETTTLRLAPPPTMLTVTASEAAEVWVDGSRYGDTPLQSAPIPLGTHQIVVKRAAGGEKRMTITAGANPVTINVDFK